MNYRTDKEFQDFIEYNDLGLPLAYAVSEDITKLTPLGEQYINESFELLLAALEVKDDTGFEELDELLGLG